MKGIELFCLLFLQITLFNNSCTENEKQIKNELVNNQSIHKNVSYQSDSTSKFIMIYDYDSEFSKLQYRTVKIKNPTGDYLRDALQAFIDNNHFLEPSDDVRFEKSEKEDEYTTLYFSGLKNTKAQKDKSVFFKKALELTIARNFQGNHFRVVLNEASP
jgi:hypothetical protein